ncbi:hypothetical protein N9Q99_01775 [Flavobacteriales bacterium]|nr:hypothetical protein [Flavobacteriales bacterium]
MKETIQTLFITSLIIMTFSSCEKPNQTDLTINFTHTVDAEELTTNSMIYSNSAGENYDVRTLKYLISDITLHAENGNEIILSDIHFIDISEESTFSFTVEDFPNNNYTSISYKMGLDTIKNTNNLHINESYHSAMVWPETNGGGYHYMKLEGAYNNDSTFYNTHTGGTMGGDYSFNNVDNISLTIDDDLGDVSININMEINNWYNSPNQIDFSSYGMGIMMNMMMQMDIKMNGITDVFSVDITK